MKKFAVVLSGCGVFDGSEIHEAVLTMLAISQQGDSYQCFAPNINQHHVVNHLKGDVDASQSRNVLVESARIARGEIKDLAEINADEFDAMVFPGGFGAAKNLCDFAFNGTDCQVNTDVINACQAFAQQQKPAGFICIAPAMIAKIYGKESKGTIGNDPQTIEQLTQMGLNHITCPVDDIVIDETNKVVSTPAYMLANNIAEAASDISKLVQQLAAMA